MRPLHYRGMVVGVAAYRNELEREFECVQKMGHKNRANVADPTKNSRPGVWFDFAESKNPYAARFGSAWRDHMPARFNVVSITDLMDHMIDEGNRLFAGTAFAHSWVIYHDALP